MATQKLLAKYIFAICLLSLFSLNTLLLVSPVYGVDFGTRLGFTIFDDEEDFTQYTLFGSWEVGERIPISGGWYLNPILELSGSLLEGSGDTGGKVATSYNLLLTSHKQRFAFIAGVGAGLLFDDTIGNSDFGGPLFFVFQGGATYRIHTSWSFGYRYYHESNFAIYDENPSLNYHQFELRYHF